MITIVEPKKYISELWGRPQIKDGAVYRLMKYVLQVEVDNELLLHNVVTGQLVVLEQSEVQALKVIPITSDPSLEQLVAGHFLVPIEYDEHQEVVNLRGILRRLDSAKKKPIIHYTILPTTGCNARCYYCYEQGIEFKKMSEDTAEKVVQYIASHRDPDSKVYITWFGGEPTTATDRIEQICYRLQELGIDYQSDIVTNAYLFDDDMVSRARNLWKLTFAQIAVDGVGESYNAVKAYVMAKDDPYERVMRNIHLLLQNGISVQIRMNFSPENYMQFKDLVHEAKQRFGDHPLLSITAHAVITDFIIDENRRDYKKEEWVAEKLFELNEYARSVGVKKTRRNLPRLSFIGCEADNETTVGINCEGKLLRCLENLQDSDMVGSITEGITNQELSASWKEVYSIEKCEGCVLFPYCMRMKNCHGGSRCISEKERIQEYIQAAKMRYVAWKAKKKGGDAL